MSPREMADGFVAADRALVEAYEALDDAQLADTRVDLGFLPEPLDIAGLVGMRLGEHALHAWTSRPRSTTTARSPQTPPSC